MAYISILGFKASGLTQKCELGSMVIDPVDGTIFAVPDVSEKGYLDVAKIRSFPTSA